MGRGLLLSQFMIRAMTDVNADDEILVLMM